MTSQSLGRIVVVAAPSGSGKTSIAKEILRRYPSFRFSVSATTRPKRPAETHGKDYFFVDHDDFRDMVENGEMLEHAKVFDNYYGTPRRPVEDALTAGKDIVFDIDWQGTQQLAEIAREDLVTVFILPPSRAELEKRLRNRSRDTRETDVEIRGRMSKAADEISHYSEYDYVIINDDIDYAITRAQVILESERLKRSRMVGLSDFVRGLRDGL